MSFERQSEAFARQFLARIVLGDPEVAALLVVDSNNLVGHCLLELIHDPNDPTVKEALGLHVQVDPGHPGAVDRLIEVSNNWGYENGASKLILRASIHTPRAWEKRYGFRLKGYEMERDIDAVWRK